MGGPRFSGILSSLIVNSLCCRDYAAGDDLPTSLAHSLGNGTHLEMAAPHFLLKSLIIVILGDFYKGTPISMKIVIFNPLKLNWRWLFD